MRLQLRLSMLLLSYCSRKGSTNQKQIVPTSKAIFHCSYTPQKKLKSHPPQSKGCSGATKTEVRFPTSVYAKVFQAFQALQDSKMPSKADLSTNWREPLPAAAAKKLAALAANPVTRILPPTEFRTRAFAKKPQPAANPFPRGPWYDLAEYKVGLKCELCKTTIRKSVFPQELQCGHICCAECIHKHYNVEHKKTCPTCKDYINEEDDPAFCRDCYSTPCECRRYDRDDNDDGCPGCGDKWCDGRCDDEPSCPHCGPGCDGTCGALGCGCIDVCRGRCDSEGYLGGW